MPSAERKARDRENRALREWAAGQGIDLPASGRIPSEVREQFHAAGGLAAVADPDPDVEPGPVAGPVDAGGGFLPPPPMGEVPPPPPGGTSPAPRTGGKGGKKSGLEVIRDDIAGGLQILGAGVMYVSPIAGRCVVDDADPVSLEIIRLGEQYPRFGEFLVEAAKVAPPLKLGRYGARWAVAAAVDRGRIPVDSMASRVFGVQDVADELVATGVIVISDEPPPPRGRGRNASADEPEAATAAA